MPEFLSGRPPLANPLGKCNTPLDALVPEVVADGIASLASVSRAAKAEVVRTIVTVGVLGKLATLPGGMRRDELGLDEALAGLAFVAGVSKAEYIESVLSEHVFGALQVRLHGVPSERGSEPAKQGGKTCSN